MFEPDLYARFIWFSVGFNSLLIMMLCFLVLAKRRAEDREAQGRAFSVQAIEGMEAERERISLELHDTVLPLVQDKEVSAIIRTLYKKLMPPDFSRLSLGDSLSDLCKQFSRRTGIECLFSIEDNLPFREIRPENQLHIYRIVQEALTNIEKHAQAKKAVVVARKQEESGQIIISVSDDGRGMVQGAESGEGFGMKTMRKRAEYIGANIEFISDIASGFQVCLTVNR
jgi:signal transduction histidine kinase